MAESFIKVLAFKRTDSSMRLRCMGTHLM